MRVFGALVLFVVVFAGRGSAKTPQKHTRELLSEQGFSGALNGKVQTRELGHLRCGKQSHRVLFYRWEEANSPGKAIHAAYRLILFDSDRYLGSYAIEGAPTRITSRAVLFPYSTQLGNQITCKDLVLGKSVILNGEPEEFFK